MVAGRRWANGEGGGGEVAGAGFGDFARAGDHSDLGGGAGGNREGERIGPRGGAWRRAGITGWVGCRGLGARTWGSDGEQEAAGDAEEVDEGGAQGAAEKWRGHRRAALGAKSVAVARGL